MAPLDLQPTYIKGYEFSYPKLAKLLEVGERDPAVFDAIVMTVHDWIPRDLYLFIGGGAKVDVKPNQCHTTAAVIVLDQDYDAKKLEERALPFI
ncbi:hypothetical protein BT69DRAFT_500977 [Atractiella rhizophila]|nr:hypothetical protein BT69DRAFT_500977 [Atractiella rhizophila]